MHDWDRDRQKKPGVAPSDAKCAIDNRACVAFVQNVTMSVPLPDFSPTFSNRKPSRGLQLLCTNLQFDRRQRRPNRMHQLMAIPSLSDGGLYICIHVPGVPEADMPSSGAHFHFGTSEPRPRYA